MTVKAHSRITPTKIQYAGNRLANQRSSNKPNYLADIFERRNLRAAVTTARRRSICDVISSKKYILTRKRKQEQYKCECKQRQCLSSSMCFISRNSHKLVKTTAESNLLKIMLLSLIKILTENIQNFHVTHCQQRNCHKTMPRKQSTYIFSTSLSVMLLISLTTLQQVHGTEHIGGDGNISSTNSSSRSSRTGSSSNSNSSSSSRDNNRRLENIVRTQQPMRVYSSATTNRSSTPSENTNENIHKTTWDSGLPSDIISKGVTNKSSVHASGSKSNESHTTIKSIPVGGNRLPRQDTIQAYSMESPENSKRTIFPNFHTNHSTQKNVNTKASSVTNTFPNSSVTTTDSSDIINVRAQENEESFTCNSCQSRERVKLYTLESIKNQILKRLRLEKPPNISIPIQVPSKILDEFYKKFNSTHYNERRQYNEQNMPLLETSPMASYDYSADMQNDEAVNEQEYVLPRDNLSITQRENNLYPETEYFEQRSSSFLHDEFYSSVNSIFLFPSKPRIRHNKKLDILNFSLEPKHLSITKTIFHIYVRGIDWIREHMPGIIERKRSNATSIEDERIVLTVHRALRKQNAVNYSHSVKLLRTNVKIPFGVGSWINIEVKQLSAFWRNNPGVTQGIIIKGLEKWMRPLIVTGDSDEALTAHIEVKVKEKHRQKRSISFDCKESDNEKRCCRYPLKVNFTNFGWEFVIAPTSFDAYFCNGECNIGFNPKHTHTYVTSLANSASPCCSPTKMSSLSLLYFNADQLLVMSTIPNMSVEQCSCL